MSGNDALAVQFDAQSKQYKLVTKQSFAKDAVIQTFTAKETLATATRYSVQVSEQKHIHLAPEFLNYTNHSCQPNCFFNTDIGQIIALRNIALGEELSFFYPATEWQMTEAFVCTCQSEQCLGVIQGAYSLSPELLKQYRINSHIAQKLQNEVSQTA